MLKTTGTGKSPETSSPLAAPDLLRGSRDPGRRACSVANTSRDPTCKTPAEKHLGSTWRPRMQSTIPASVPCVESSNARPHEVGVCAGWIAPWLVSYSCTLGALNGVAPPLVSSIQQKTTNQKVLTIVATATIRPSRSHVVLQTEASPQRIKRQKAAILPVPKHETKGGCPWQTLQLRRHSAWHRPRLDTSDKISEKQQARLSTTLPGRELPHFQSLSASGCRGVRTPRNTSASCIRTTAHTFAPLWSRRFRKLSEPKAWIMELQSCSPTRMHARVVGRILRGTAGNCCITDLLKIRQ